MWRRALEFPFKGDWTGPGPSVALTNWVPSFTPTLPHLLLAICLSTPFLEKAKDEGWGRDCQFQLSLIKWLVPSWVRGPGDVRGARKFQRSWRKQCLLHRYCSQPTSATFHLGDFHKLLNLSVLQYLLLGKSHLGGVENLKNSQS